MSESYNKRIRKEYFLTVLDNENFDMSTTYVPDAPIVLKTFDPNYFGTPYCIESFVVYTRNTDGFLNGAATGDVLTLTVEEENPSGGWEVVSPVEGVLTYTVPASPGLGQVLWLREFRTARKCRISISCDAAPAANDIKLMFDYSVKRIFA